MTLEFQIVPGGPFIKFGPALTDVLSANAIGASPMAFEKARLRQTGDLVGGTSPTLTAHILVT